MRFVKPVFKSIMTIVIFALVVLVPIKIVPMVHQWLEEREAGHKKHAAEVHDEKMHELASDQPNTLVVAPDVFKSMRMTVAEVQPPVSPEPLKLDGSLFLLSNSMVHQHSRFAGDVVEIGEFEDPVAVGSGSDSVPDKPREKRPLQFGDFVHKGQLLAVIWSKEIGEKKSELVDAVSKYEFDRKALKAMESAREGTVAGMKLIEANRNVEADLVAIDKAERTLKSWQVSIPELEAIRNEAQKIRERAGRPDDSLTRNWARVEVRSFVEGTIVEKNVNVGDYVNTDLVLFKIADLSRMNVLAHAYEEDLSVLEGIPQGARDWKIFVKADPREEPLRGSFDRIGDIIDPTQHTALVMGWVDNSRGRLRVGQFITARVELPVPADEVTIPVSALVDQDGNSFVFVRSPANPQRFTRRQVFPVRRRDDLVSLARRPRWRSSDAAVEPLAVGDWVVTTGGLQLAAELTYLESQAKTELTSK